MKKIYFSLTISLSTLFCFAQTPLSEADFVAAVLKTNPAIKAANLGIEQQKILRGASFNIPNPTIGTESPTGRFYTFTIQQDFEFPTVYRQRARVQEQIIALSQRQMQLTETELRRLARSVYLELQYARSLSAVLQQQDSFYQAIAKAAERQYSGGQINALEQLTAQRRATESRQLWQQAQSDTAFLTDQIKQLGGFTEGVIVLDLVKNNAFLLEKTVISQNPTLSILQQTQALRQQEVALEKAKALPSFYVGYFNQAERETDLALRWRVGMGVPLWRGQFKANINAAQKSVDVAAANLSTQQQSLELAVQQSLAEARKLDIAINTYSTTTLRQAEDIIAISTKLQKGGELDLVAHLRNVAEAFQLKNNYLDIIKKYNQTIVELDFLTGKN